MELPIQDFASNRRFYEVLAGVDLANKKVLDIGCGDGSDLKNYEKRGALPYGIDPSEAFIEIAKGELPKAVLLVSGGEQLPFEDKSFDIVVSKYAMQTSQNIPQVLREVARVLRGGGVFICLSKHPLRQFLENIDTHGGVANYFEQRIVNSFIYNHSIQLKEPTHALGEYLSAEVLRCFELVNFIEDYDFPSSEQLGGHIYPTFFVAHFKRR